MNSRISRRGFFWNAADETIALVEHLWGRPSLKLSALDTLSDAEMANLIPVFTPEAELAIEGGMIVARLRDDSPARSLCAEGSRADYILRSMDGVACLRGIAARMAELWSEPESQSFVEVRRFFLEMVVKGVCLPGNLPGPP